MQFAVQNRLSRLLCLGAVLLCLATSACAQSPQPGQPGPGQVDVALTYTGTHANRTDTTPFWLQGAGLAVNARFYRGLGLSASATGSHAGPGTNVAGLDLVTIAFGPSYTIDAGRRVSVFGEALLGEAHGLHSLFSYGSGPLPSLTAGTTDSANAFALQTGGGISLRLSSRFLIRPVQVDYLRTELPNGGTNVQNNLRVAGGIVVAFGGEKVSPRAVKR